MVFRFEDKSVAKGEIQVLEENQTTGEDFIIGDIHGSINEFNKVLSKVRANPHNRLFLAGDLGDRGPGSFLIYETIMAINSEREAKNLPPQIYSVRGNHEDALLDYALAKSAHEEAAKTYQHVLSRYNYLKDELEKGIAEREADKIALADKTQKINPARVKANKNYVIDLNVEVQKFYEESLDLYEDLVEARAELKTSEKLLLNPNFGGLWALQLSNEKLASVAEFISSLPHIIHVEGADPFNVVHADLPFSYEELQTRIQSGKLKLAPEEKRYALWARVNDADMPINDSNESSDDPPTYCGHSIGGGVRPKRNHNNLDSGTYYSSCFCVVLHKSKKCILSGDKSKFNIMLRKNGAITPTTIKNQLQDNLDKMTIRKHLAEVTDYLTYLQNNINMTVKKHKLWTWLTTRSKPIIDRIVRKYNNHDLEILALIKKAPDLEKSIKLLPFFSGLQKILSQKNQEAVKIMAEVDAALLNHEKMLVENSSFTLNALLRSLGGAGNKIVDDIMYGVKPTDAKKASSSKMFASLTESKKIPSIKKRDSIKKKTVTRLPEIKWK